MAFRQALSTLQRMASSRLVAPRAVSAGSAGGSREGRSDTAEAHTAPPLCVPQFGTSTAWQSAVAQEDTSAPLPEPETTGWGSTRVGELLKAKVRGLARAFGAHPAQRSQPETFCPAWSAGGQRRVAVVLGGRHGH